MGKIITVENNQYELIKNYREAFNEKEFQERCTEYFYDYDYIVGDIAYSKLRLKGFYEANNKCVKKLNNYDYLDEYLKTNCAVDCKYFVVKKVRNSGRI